MNTQSISCKKYLIKETEDPPKLFTHIQMFGPHPKLQAMISTTLAKMIKVGTTAFKVLERYADFAA